GRRGGRSRRGPRRAESRRVPDPGRPRSHDLLGDEEVIRRPLVAAVLGLAGSIVPCTPSRSQTAPGNAPATNAPAASAPASGSRKTDAQQPPTVDTAKIQRF